MVHPKIPAARLAALAFALAAPVTFAQTTPGPRRTEPADRPEMQQALAETHPGFRAFVAKAGGRWSARFDEASGAPTMIVGDGVPLPGGRVADLAAAAAHARRALETFAELWGAPIAQLHLVDAVKTGPLFVFTWQQRFLGLDVRRARVQIQVHEAGSIAALSTTAVAIPESFSRIPALSADDAVRAVAAGKRLAPGDSVEAVDFLVFARAAGGAATPRLAYRVDVAQPSAGVFERVFVDGDGGAILAVEPARYDAFDVKGRVTGNGNAALSAMAAPTNVPLANVSVGIAGVGSATTDANGNYFFATAQSGPFTVAASLAGPTYTISTGIGSPLVASATTTNVGGVDVADLLFNPSPSETTTAQVSGAMHHAAVRAYVQSKLPSFAPVGTQMVLVNDTTVVCNGLYVGFIKLAPSMLPCQNFAFSTLIDHEFGHGVDDFFGGILSTTFTEGLADMVAMYATGQPVIGQDYQGPGTILRTGENFTSWPAASCGGEPHCVGETFMGFAWQARKKLVAALGQAAGVAAAEHALLGILPVNNASIPDGVTQAFLVDDDDGNLNNGTPHYAQLAEAAVMKGFTPPTFLLFANATTAPTGQRPISIALADVNGDGKADAITANQTSNTVSVLLGNGAGGFTPQPIVAAGLQPNFVAVADLNADGHLDLVVARAAAGIVTPYFGNGGGGFAAGPALAVGASPSSVAIADVNADGKPDLVSASSGGTDLSLLLGAGAGAFAPAASVPVGTAPFSVAVADVNADGRPDLVTSNYSASTVSVLLGTGPGAFGAPAAYPVGAQPAQIVACDVDGDGAIDLLTANNVGKNVSLLLGVGAGAFSPAASLALSPNASPFSLAVTDFDSDGRPDVATANTTSNNVSVLLGGAAGFAAPLTFAAGTNTIAIAVADLQGDGHADAVASNYITNNVSIFRNLSILPPSVAAFGAGTAGCAGRLGMSANAPPHVGGAAFAVTCANAPRNALGLGLLANAQDVAGSDPLGFGFTLHVDLFASTLLAGLDFRSDAGGSAVAHAPIPSAPGLAGQTVFVQAVWLGKAADGQACGASPFGFASSSAVSVTVLP